MGSSHTQSTPRSSGSARTRLYYACFAIGVLIVVITGHMISLDSAKAIIISNIPALVVLGAALFAFGSLSYLIIRRRFRKKLDLLNVILAVGVIAAGHFAAVAVHESWHPHGLWYAALIAALLVGLVLIDRTRDVLERYRTFSRPRFTEEALQDHKVSSLIMLMSTNKDRIDWPRGSPELFVYDIAKKEHLPRCHLTGNLAKDIEASSGFPLWNWQQLLRAIEPYLADRPLANLRRVYVVPSPQASQAQIDDCIRLLKFYLDRASPGGDSPSPRRAIDVSQCKPVNFEDFDALVSAFVERGGILERLVREHGIPHHEIIIDVTGGQKTASIAAAIVTLNGETLFQYVQTNPPFKPILYDARFDAPPNLG